MPLQRAVRCCHRCIEQSHQFVIGQDMEALEQTTKIGGCTLPVASFEIVSFEALQVASYTELCLGHLLHTPGQLVHTGNQLTDMPGQFIHAP